eukprot:gene10895-11049_t
MGLSALLNLVMNIFLPFPLPYGAKQHQEIQCQPHMRLQQYARDARKEYAELGNKDLTGLKTFVKGLPKLLLLDRLSDLAAPVAEVVKEQVEQDIIDSFDVEDSIHFIQHLPTLNNLERSGLLKPQGPGTRNNFATVRKALRLIVNDEDQMTNPTDISYLYKGYAPLTIRLVEAALKGGWGPFAEVLSMLPGAQFDVLQVVEPSGQVADRQLKPGAWPYAARTGATCRFLVLTTKIINGRTLLDSFVDSPARCIRKA